jgi:pSer/pThr/pTyr-binding forkhead associated (FHA) protein
MAFYIEFDEKTIEVQKSITIGRGSPFENLLKYRDVARAHARVFTKRGKLYIRDLNSESGTYINGRRIQPEKNYLIEKRDNIRISNHPIRISFFTDANEIDEVKKLKSKNKSPFLGKYVIASALMTPLIIYYSDTSIKEKVVYIVGLLSLHGIIFYEMTKSAFSEVFLGDKGFTLHFKDGKNMSFKYKDIKQILITNGKIQIKAYNKYFIYNSIDSNGQFIKELKKKCYKKIKKVNPISLHFYQIMIGFSPSAILYFLMNTENKIFIFVLYILLLFNLFLYAVIKNFITEKLLIDSLTEKRFRKRSAIVFLVVIGYLVKYIIYET